MYIHFAKYVALGNDFLLLDGGQSPSPALVRTLCRRHEGVGADGLIHLSQGPAGEYQLNLWNADGSEGGFSGNGLRCAACHLARQSPDQKLPFLFSTAAGTVAADMVAADTNGDEQIRLIFDELADKRPTTYEGPSLAHLVGAAPNEIACLDIGNPHLLIVMGTTALDTLALDEAGLDTLRKSDSIVPGGINVSVASCREGSHYAMRTWERGVGATSACGSAALALFLAVTTTNAAIRHMTVAQVGGSLRFELTEGRISMVGSARLVFEGCWEGMDEE